MVAGCGGGGSTCGSLAGSVALPAQCLWQSPTAVSMSPVWWERRAVVKLTVLPDDILMLGFSLQTEQWDLAKIR